MLKVIFCLQYFFPEYVGGTEIYTLRLAQHLKQLGMEPVIVIPGFDQSLSTEYAYEQIRVVKYAENSIEDRLMIMGNKKPGGLAKFEEILNLEKPDIVHFHELSSGRGINIFHVEKAHDLDIPIVLTFHLSYYSCIKSSLIYKEKEKCDGIIRVKRCTDCVYHEKNLTGIKAKILSNAAFSLYKLKLNLTGLNSTLSTALGFPFVINKIKMDLLRLSAIAEKIVVIADWYREILEKNGVPATKLMYVKQGLPGKARMSSAHTKVRLPLKVVYIGRISALKGVHLLVDAVCSLPEDHISLHLYGPGADEDFGMALKQRTWMKKNIHWEGIVRSEDVVTALSSYHVLCLPSLFEMNPLVIQEAFAAGLPVLASNAYGNTEQIQDGINGWLFRFKDRNDLVVKLRYLIDDPGLIETARLNLPIANSFSDVAKKHIALYNTISHSKKQIT